MLAWQAQDGSIAGAGREQPAVRAERDGEDGALVAYSGRAEQAVDGEVPQLDGVVRCAGRCDGAVRRYRRGLHDAGRAHDAGRRRTGVRGEQAGADLDGAGDPKRGEREQRGQGRVGSAQTVRGDRDIARYGQVPLGFRRVALHVRIPRQPGRHRSRSGSIRRDGERG